MGAAETTPRPVCVATSAGVFELAFPGHALERLVGVLDAVLVVGAVRREQPHDLIGAVGSHMADRAGGEVDSLADIKLVFFQRSSPELERRTDLPLCKAALSPNRREYSSEIRNCLKNSLFRPAIGPEMKYFAFPIVCEP